MLRSRYASDIAERGYRIPLTRKSGLVLVCVRCIITGGVLDSRSVSNLVLVTRIMSAVRSDVSSD